MDYEQAKDLFNELYQDVDGHSISLRGRSSGKYADDKSVVYGEVKFDTFYQILKEVPMKPGGTFVDLGSGTGKAVFLTYLLFDFKKNVGIELVDTLYESSVDTLKKFDDKIKPKIKETVGEKQIKFYPGSLLMYDVGEADLVFMNSTCFSNELMAAIEHHLQNLKPGAHIISLSKSLVDPPYEVLSSKLMEFSWGEATVYHHRKR